MVCVGIKGYSYDTFLVQAVGDTYDGSIHSEDDGRPECLSNLALPQLHLFSGENEETLLCGAAETSSLKLSHQLDDTFPDSSKLWPPIDSDGHPSCSSEDVRAMAKAFGESVPTTAARESSRAAWLFCQEEGYRLDALPRSTFETFLDKVEELLGHHTSGPFFCGAALSAADIIWAPLLERYAVQLPCLHANLNPRGAKDWPKLEEWYQAMDQLPSYVCRMQPLGERFYLSIHGPKADLWHPGTPSVQRGNFVYPKRSVVNYFSAGHSSTTAAEMLISGLSMQRSDHTCPLMVQGAKRHWL